MATDHISLEPLLNDSTIGTGTSQRIAVVNVNSLGTCLQRAAINVTDTAQEITITTGYRTMYLYNAGNALVYIGGATVDSTNGVPLVDGQLFIFNNVQDDFSFYLVCAAADSPVEVRICEFT